MVRDGVYLASEKKALLPFAEAATVGDAGVDTASLSHYLTLQYVPEPRTLHRGVERLGSGESLTWTPGRDRGAPAVLPAGVPARRRSDDERRSTSASGRRCATASGCTCASDVPVGAFLSSGIDSTAIVALAREFNPDMLTFTVGYDVPGYSEIDVAQDSARLLGVTTIPTVIGPQDMMDGAAKDRLAPRRPGRRPGAGAAVLRGEEAAEHVTVVLSGEGADELFGGYTIYREPLSLARVQALPDPVQRGLRAGRRVIPEGVQGQELPGARHHPDRGALLRQRPDLHRARQARGCCAATTPRCATRT